VTRPTFVIVSGPPASGKTTLARPLAQALGLPLFGKDPIKERLADCLGEGPREHSRALGLAAVLMLLDVAGEMLTAGHSVMLESYFHHGKAEPELGPLTRMANTVLVHCTASRETLIDRYTARMSLPARHAIHEIGLDVDKQTSLLGVREADEPLDLTVPRLVVSTSGSFPDAAQIAPLVRYLLGPDCQRQKTETHWP
jgi:predicted kinase